MRLQGDGWGVACIRRETGDLSARWRRRRLQGDGCGVVSIRCETDKLSVSFMRGRLHSDGAGASQQPAWIPGIEGQALANPRQMASPVTDAAREP